MKKKLLLGLITFLAITSHSLGGTFYNGFYHNDLNGSDWHNYGSSKGTVAVSEDGEGEHRVTFTGNGTKTGFYRRLTPIVENGAKVVFTLEFTRYFTVYLQVMTTKGIRYLTYYPLDKNFGKNGKFIKLGLGKKARNGYFVFNRDLQKDLRRYERDNVLTEVRAFFIRGSGSMGMISVNPGTNAKLLELFNDYKNKDSYVLKTFSNNNIIGAHLANWDEMYDFPTFFHILSKDKKSLINLFPDSRFPDKKNFYGNTLCNYKTFSDDKLTHAKKGIEFSFNKLTLRYPPSSDKACILNPRRANYPSYREEIYDISDLYNVRLISNSIVK